MIKPASTTDLDDADSRNRLPLPLKTLIGFATAIAAVLLIAFFSDRSLSIQATAANEVTHTLNVIRELSAGLSDIKDAETGQRGYLLTGTESYLQPFDDAKAAVGEDMKRLQALSADNPSQLQRLGTLESLIADKMQELDRTIELRHSGDVDGAMELVRTNRGKELMDHIRSTVAEMDADERKLLDQRQQQWRSSIQVTTLVSWSGSTVLLVLICVAAGMASRDFRLRENHAWLRAGQMGLALRLQGEQRLDQLCERALAYLAQYLDARVGAAYIVEGDGSFRCYGRYALAQRTAEDTLQPGDGMLGEAIRQKRTVHVRTVPEGYLPVASGLGRTTPVELLIAPGAVDGMVQAVIELGFFRKLKPEDCELLDRVSEFLGMAVRSARDRSRLESLLEETQRQAEELQVQQEELRVSNEELEAQGQVLKDSQAQLEAQRAELEQINSQLEEQTRLLEEQNDSLSEAQKTLGERALELERASRYKSEFLANMSHELRTPLNSSLILSRLLADNKDGNLTPEQVRYALTISSAGNDLLALINDILDLSKIESGKVDVLSAPVTITRTVEALVRTFEPIVRQKGLQLATTIDSGTPEYIETDGQRLGQILTNLMSNALKFTERGEVGLKVSPGPENSVLFTVTDTGIGIPVAQQEMIFEAFRQADGSTHRKYGGTGLGLSISRLLARLLGGDIVVQSAPQVGSSFILKLPSVLSATAIEAPAPAAMAPMPAPAMSTAAVELLSPGTFDDDRGRLVPGSRVILVVEDDVHFAAILRDLVREAGFLCVVAQTADSGLAAAIRYQPRAILLDVNLPDYSGLGVLDHLKHNSTTRHIPVHIISVADYSRAALELGAVGYALKPVKREQINAALRLLDAKFSQGLKNVLVVDDDEVQRHSIRQLLANDNVRITEAASADAALDLLLSTSFDCVVMDLNLPRVTGFDLLQRMAEREDMPFPPVIIYTGRSLTAEEERRLRRFSRSIIIKDARSPERLLDEVTLFLHQVESKLPPEHQRMLKSARDREAALDGRRILIVEDDVRNVFALTSVLEPRGARVEIARNGIEAIATLDAQSPDENKIDLVLMDIMMPEMDGYTAMREIRKRAEWERLPIIALTAKAMKDDQEKCISAGANDYISKPLDVEKLLSLIRVWMPK